MVCIHAAGDGDFLGDEAEEGEVMSCLGPVFQMVFILSGTPIYSTESHLILFTIQHPENYCMGPDMYVGRPE